MKIDLPREFYSEIIDYDKFDERIHIIKEKIQNLDNKPMLDLTVAGGDFESAEVYEIIQNTIGDGVLNLRPSFKPDKVLKEEKAIDPDKILDPRSLLHKKVNEKYGEDEGNLSVELMDNLSIGRIDDAKFISDRYYGNHYKIENEDDENLNKNSDYHKQENEDNENLNKNSNDDKQEDMSKSSKDNSDEINQKSKQMSFDDF